LLPREPLFDEHADRVADGREAHTELRRDLLAAERPVREKHDEDLSLRGRKTVLRRLHPPLVLDRKAELVKGGGDGPLDRFRARVEEAFVLWIHARAPGWR